MRHGPGGDQPGAAGGGVGRLLLLLQGITATSALKLAALAPQDPGACASSEVNASFEPLPELSAPGQEAARRSFLKVLASGPMADVLCTNRHRCCKNADRPPLPVPKVLRMFDWHFIHEPQEAATKDEGSIAAPRSVYCNSDALDECLNATSKLQRLRPGDTRVLAIGGEDTKLSSVEGSVRRLQETGKYSRVLFEAKDLALDGVAAFPTCLNSWYISKNAPEQMAREIREASFEKKTEGVLAAWGYQWRYLDLTLRSRRQAVAFTSRSCVAPRQMLEPADYWRQLARHRFLLAPTGQGVFEPKVMEALLVLTVPIVQRMGESGAWEELRDAYGWPLVIVDRWEEVEQPGNLQRWWRQWAPQLQAARLRLTSDYFFHVAVGQFL